LSIALAVVFDEAASNRKKSAHRVQKPDFFSKRANMSQKWQNSIKNRVLLLDIDG
jgi:hypothetical protein